MSEPESALSAEERSRRIQNLEDFNDGLAAPGDLQKLKDILLHYLKQDDEAEETDA